MAMEEVEEEEDKNRMKQKSFTSFCAIGLVIYQNYHGVTPTTSTAYALFLAREAETPFQLIIASYNVPDMVSLSFLRAMHQKDIPFIFMFSESNGDGDIPNVLAGGAHSFLKKPIAPVQLKYVWQAASIKMLERQRKGIELQNNNEKAPVVITMKDSSGDQQIGGSRRKKSNCAMRRKTEEKRNHEKRSHSLPHVRTSIATGAQQQLEMESQQIQVQAGLATGAAAGAVNQNTFPAAPAVTIQRQSAPVPAGQVIAGYASNQPNLNQSQEGVLDQLSRVLLDQEPEESGLVLDPHLVEQYFKYFKS